MTWGPLQTPDSTGLPTKEYQADRMHGFDKPKIRNLGPAQLNKTLHYLKKKREDLDPFDQNYEKEKNDIDHKIAEISRALGDIVDHIDPALKKAQTAVYKAIDRALTKNIYKDQNTAFLIKYLSKETITTGYKCKYEPIHNEKIKWILYQNEPTH